MTTSTKTQIRGNCQCCGAQQAIVNGTMAKHGYTVKHGYFEGACPGHRYAPMQADISTSTQIVTDVRADAVKLNQTAEDLKVGKIHPLEVATGTLTFVNGKRTPVMIAFADATLGQQERAVNIAVARAESRARMALGFARDLETLADQKHGTEVVTLTIAAAAPAILTGEKRFNSNGITLVARFTERARVYYAIMRADGKSFQGWMGIAAWRKLPLIETVAA
jgi:hypothetical protein